MHFRTLFLPLLAVAPVATLAAQWEAAQSSRTTPPKPLREFRAAWVATVANIDWPSQKGLSTAEQKAELIAILDRAVQLKLNAIIFQVRPACDALYASTIEPWSEYLTGTMGQAPAPFYDPLSFAVEEAHKRGLELHAWFNPYRAVHPSAKSAVSQNHISKTRPQLVRRYGKNMWLDPGEPEVQDYSLSVVMDVVRRYDIDGVHFDDYFYPYKEHDASGNDMDFPDDASWKRFGATSGFARDDWRRENVNTFLRRTYQSIKAAKPWVKFGISPFGIWRPGYPQQIKGHDAYAKLYADSRKWLVNGWVDYFAPQLYWAIKPPDQSFPVLLKWWTQQNAKGRHIYPGLDATKTRREWSPEEIVEQIRLTRKLSLADGEILWNMRSLMRNTALQDALLAQVYSQPALVPASPWLGSSPQSAPRISMNRSGAHLKVSWSSSRPQGAWLWLLQSRTGSTWSTEILPGNKTARTWNSGIPSFVSLSAVDRNGNLSLPATSEIARY